MTYDTINNAQTVAGNGEETLFANRYRIVRQLGAGGMGSVWLAEDTQLDNKQFAIKMLPSILVANKRAYRQLKDEALVAMRLVHPNIVQIRAFEENNGNPFLVMDYVDGQTLDDYLADKGKLSEDEVIRVLRPIAAALDYAHGEGVVHRDVKPANVMIRKDGHPFILDFGIAREIQETMTRVTGKLSSGTLLYMSPEQLNGEQPRPAQDIYSFAAMAYECIKGEPPFVRGAIEDQIKNKLPDPLPVGRGILSVPLAASIMVGLAKKAKDRPRNCAAVLEGDKVVSRRGAEAQRNLSGCAESVGRGAPTAPHGRAGSPLPAEIGRARSPNRSQPQGGVAASGSEKINVPKSDWPYLPPDMRPHPGGGVGHGVPAAPKTAPGFSRAEHVERVESAGLPTAPKTDAADRARSPSAPLGGVWKMLFVGTALAFAVAAGLWWKNNHTPPPDRGTSLVPGEELDDNTTDKAEEPIVRDRTAANEIRDEAVAQQREVDDISDEDGFAQEKKGLADVFKEADDCFKVEHWSEAAVGFTNYVEKCKRLKKLDGERNSAVNSRDLAKKEKEEAEKVKAEKYVKSLWDEAVKSFDLGNKKFGIKQFLSASNLFATAAIQFKRCVESIPSEPPNPPSDAKKAALEIFEKAKELRKQMALISGDDGFEALKNAHSSDFQIAEGFLKNEIWEKAAENFTNFVVKVNAMLELDKNRRNALKKKEAAEGAKERAQQAEAEKYVRWTGWDEACKIFDEAIGAYKKVNFSEAEAKFEEAFGLFEKCEQNAKEKMAEAKRDAETVRDEAERKKSEAERMKANETADSTWSKAISSWQSGYYEFRQGNYSLAHDNFKEATSSFESCINEATRKQKEAERPRVHLIATLGGATKKALIVKGMPVNDRYWTPLTFDVGSPVNSSVEYGVEYFEDGVKYVGEGSYIVKSGLQYIEIVLTRAEEPKRPRPATMNYCRHCGYSLEAFSTVGQRCPKCDKNLWGK